MVGQTVRTIASNNVANNQIEVDLSDMAAGTYMLSIRTNNGTAVKRVVIAH